MPLVNDFIVIVPAAGVGKRMQANCPKQYLTINNKTILTHTLTKLLTHPRINKVVLALGENDQYFAESDFVEHHNVVRVNGGKERVNSVLNGLLTIDANDYPWVLVHDAARPCLTHQDIDKLIQSCLSNHCGGLLASPVRDTMKRSCATSSKSNAELTLALTSELPLELTLEHEEQQNTCTLNKVKKTIDRNQLWHALTPQLYKTTELLFAIEQSLSQSLNITDESSAMELAGFDSLLVEGSSENIKITHPDDLALAEFYLTKQNTALLRNKECV